MFFYEDILTIRNSMDRSALYRVPKVLLGGGEETGNTEDGEGVLVVEAEGGVVNQAFLEVNKPFETSKISQHRWFINLEKNSSV